MVDVPQLSLSPQDIDDLTSGEDAAGDVTDRIVGLLKSHPHFFVLKGVPATEDRTLTVNIARAIADTEPFKPGRPPEMRHKVSFTRVQIDPEKSADNSAVTRYSRTNQPLELHTDSSYMNDPHELVAFQMVRAESQGGDTLMAAVEDVVAALDEEVRTNLSEINFPFGRGPQPVLWTRKGATHIRYYRSQIETARLDEDEDELADQDLAAMDALDDVLAREDLQFRFHVAPGETVFMHNTKALHGRTGFPADSDRLMYRIRMHAGCLG